MEVQPPNSQKYPLRMPIRVTHKNNMPCIELRRCIQLTLNDDMNNEMLKTIISCAVHGIPITIIPSYTDHIRAMGRLIEAGFIYYENEEKKYYFTF